MATADQLIAILDSWVGTREDPPHSNRTFIGREFGYDGVAWCAETMSVAQDRIGLHCFHTAAVSEAMRLCKAGQHGMTWVPRDAPIRKGDMPCFDWKGHGNPSDFHISAVRDPGTQAKFQTDGGNENDAVTQQWRDRTYVMGFIRLPFDTTPAPTPEDDLTKDEHDMLTQIHGAVADIQSRVGNDVEPRLASLEAKFDKHFPPPVEPKNP